MCNIFPSHSPFANMSIFFCHKKSIFVFVDKTKTHCMYYIHHTCDEIISSLKSITNNLCLQETGMRILSINKIYFFQVAYNFVAKILWQSSLSLIKLIIVLKEKYFVELSIFYTKYNIWFWSKMVVFIKDPLSEQLSSLGYYWLY